MVALRLHAFVIVSAGSLFTWLCPLNAGDSAAVPDMRQLLSTAVRQRFPAALPAVAAPGPHPDPEIVTLPPFLVPAPELRVPAPADTVRPVIGFVRPVSYTAYAAQDQKQQE